MPSCDRTSCPINTTTNQGSEYCMASRLSAGAIALCLFASWPAFSEFVSTLEQQTRVAVTIYNENLALVKDSRTVTIPAGEQTLALRGVSARLRPETALLRNKNSGDRLDILEQNFDFDLLTPQTLLEKYVGKEVGLITVNPVSGIEEEQRATVLSTNNGTVVRLGDRIEANPPGRFVFDALPANLRDQPTLSVMLRSDSPKPKELQLSYLTGGLSWKADYVAELSGDDATLDLTGWVTLNNTSGTSYNNAHMQLVAGDINIVRQQMAARATHRMASLEMSADKAPKMSEESLFEYHLYTLNRPATIQNQQSKQVSLLAAANIPVTKELVLSGDHYYYRSSTTRIGEKLKFGVYVEVANEKDAGLGLALPKGVVRVYKRDASNAIQFVGEDRIGHTPNKDKIRLKLGEAFDVVADKKQTQFKVKERVMMSDVYESSYDIVVTNGKKSATDVFIREPIPGDWKIVSENFSHEKVNASTAQWRLQIPAESSVTLSYSTQVKI
ncbi:MAG: DUF4139 domain-containing protein [Pseudomonadales bacterium]|nr:DUF4139 domain-containing protein [Pseudomonadales bacterium]MDG2078221.1 DUF4139 domain-containing protein [Pseudomonadales bacterium]